MDNENNSAGAGGGGEKPSHRVALSGVVTDCLSRWFRDTLKEAKAGDLSMQVLVSQMYYNGYGIPIDHQKAKIWMTRAARVRSSVWKVSKKRPGNFPASNFNYLKASPGGHFLNNFLGLFLRTRML